MKPTFKILKTKFKKTICSLLVIAPISFTTISLSSCNYEAKVTNHNVTSIKTLALDSVVSNFDEINFENLKTTDKVEVKMVAEIDHKSYEMQVNIASNTPDTIVVGLHVSNNNLHLENNTPATLHEIIFINNKIIDTKDIDVLISQQSFPVNFVEFTISDQTIKAGTKSPIGEFTSSYKDVGNFVFAYDQQILSLKIDANNKIYMELADCDHEQTMKGHITNNHNGKSYVSNDITITVKKTDTAATFTKVEAPKGKAGSEIAIGTFETKFGSLKDITEVKFTITAGEPRNVKIDDKGNATIATAESNIGVSLTGTLSAKVEGRDQTFGDLTITVEKTDTVVTFKKIEAPIGKAGDEIAIGTFETKFGTLKDITEAKLVTKANEEIKVEIATDGKATIKTDESAEAAGTLEGTLSAKVEDRDQTFGDLTITVKKTDTAATFTKVEAPKGKAGSEIAIGTFETKFGSLKDITKVKFTITAGEPRNVKIDDKGNATIATAESNIGVSLTGTLSAKVEGRDQTFGDLTITVEKTDTVVTFIKNDDLHSRPDVLLVIGKFKINFGSIADITETFFHVNNTGGTVWPRPVADNGEVSMMIRWNKTYIIKGNLSAKINGEWQTFEEITIRID